jgi:hypothetical protein
VLAEVVVPVPALHGLPLPQLGAAVILLACLAWAWKRPAVKLLLIVGAAIFLTYYFMRHH